MGWCGKKATEALPPVDSTQVWRVTIARFGQFDSPAASTLVASVRKNDRVRALPARLKRRRCHSETRPRHSRPQRGFADLDPQRSEIYPAASRKSGWFPRTLSPGFARPRGKAMVPLSPRSDLGSAGFLPQGARRATFSPIEHQIEGLSAGGDNSRDMQESPLLSALSKRNHQIL